MKASNNNTQAISDREKSEAVMRNNELNDFSRDANDNNDNTTEINENAS